jgi:hypothetical protein
MNLQIQKGTSNMSLNDSTGPYTTAWLVSWPIPGKDDVPLRWEKGLGSDYVHQGVVRHLTDTGLYHRGADAIGFLLESVDGLALKAVVLVCTRDATINVDMDWTINLDPMHLWGGLR